MLPNPFVIGSGMLLTATRRSRENYLSKADTGCCAGPPGTNYAVMKKAFEEGWGAVIAKTISVDSSKARTLANTGNKASACSGQAAKAE